MGLLFDKDQEMPHSVFAVDRDETEHLISSHKTDESARFAAQTKSDELANAYVDDGTRGARSVVVRPGGSSIKVPYWDKRKAVAV